MFHLGEDIQSHPMVDSSKKIAIVIVSYNRLDMLEQCLAAIRSSTRYPYELVLVDNGSDEETRTFIDGQEDKGDVRCIFGTAKNEGFARGYNAGLALMDSEHFVVMNNDTIPYDGWLGRLMDVFIAHPYAGLVSPYTNYTGANSMRCRKEYATLTTTELVEGDLPAICWLVSRECHDAVCEVIEKLGGGRNFFHAEFDYGFAEDIVTSLVISKLGFEKYVAGGSFIFHYGMATQRILENYSFRGRNKVKLEWCKKMLEGMEF